MKLNKINKFKIVLVGKKLEKEMQIGMDSQFVGLRGAVVVNTLKRNQLF